MFTIYFFFCLTVPYFCCFIFYLKRNTLHNTDWVDSLVTDGRTAQDIIEDCPRGARTGLSNNASVLAQQSGKYSAQCGLVVLFDYQNMIVLDFTPGNSPQDDVTNPVRYHFSSGSRMTHKQLLIAALIYGVRKADLMNVTGG